MNLKKKPFLLVDGDSGEARLLTRKEAAKRMFDGEGDSLAVILDLGRCCGVFKRRAKGKQEWSLADLVAVTGLPPRTVDSWVRAGVIPCSIRPGDGQRGRNGKRVYSRQDAFIAAVTASIRRQCMLPLPMLAKVSELLANANETAVDVVDIERN